MLAILVFTLLSAEIHCISLVLVWLLVICLLSTGVTVTSQKTLNWWIHKVCSLLQDYIGRTLYSLLCSFCWVCSCKGTRRATVWICTLKGTCWRHLQLLLHDKPANLASTKIPLQTLITVLAQCSEWFSNCLYLFAILYCTGSCDKYNSTHG